MRIISRTLFEFLIVTVIGSAIALAANGVSRKGLRVSQNYFPKKPVASRPAAATQPSTQAAKNMPPASRPAEEPIYQDIRDMGLQPLHHEDVETAFRDPMHEAKLFIFVDARNDEHFEQGHIPGALHFDRYRPEDYLPTVMQAAQQAQKVIVYCGGGDCEDSKFAAMQLRDAGVDPTRLFVYVGGIKEWTQRKLPLETGK